MIKQNQHYVPRVYLQQFCFDEEGNTYYLPFKLLHNSIIVKETNKSKICYSTNMYKFTDEKYVNKNINNDKNYIENNLFDYEDSFIKEISLKLENREQLLRSDARRLVKFMLSFKGRNKHMKDKFNNKHLFKKLINQKTENIRGLLTYLRFQHGSNIIDDFIELINEKLNNEVDKKDSLDNLYRFLLIEREKGENESRNWLIDKMTNSYLKVFLTNDDNPFVTSDNPGYTFQFDGSFKDTSFSTAKSFSFPITPKMLITLTSDIHEDSRLIKKNCEYVNVNEGFVEIANCGTTHVSIKYIYSNRKETLNSIKKKFHSSYVRSIKIEK